MLFQLLLGWLARVSGDSGNYGFVGLLLDVDLLLNHRLDSVVTILIRKGWLPNEWYDAITRVVQSVNAVVVASRIPASISSSSTTECPRGRVEDRRFAWTLFGSYGEAARSWVHQLYALAPCRPKSDSSRSATYSPPRRS